MTYKFNRLIKLNRPIKLNNLTTNIIPKMSKLQIVSSLALASTAVFFPNMRYLVYQTAACITSVSVIDKICNWVRWKYPDYTRTNYYLSIFEGLSKIALLGHTSNNLGVLSKAHGKGVIGFVHWSASHWYNIANCMIYYPYVIGTIAWLVVMIVGPIIGEKLRSWLPIMNSFVTAIQNNQNFDINYHGVNLVHNGPQSTLNAKSLEELCPLRCPSLENNKRESSTEYTVPENCSVCCEVYSEKQLTRTLPCNHSFHAYCIDPWLLQSSSVCPICRKDVLTQ